MRTRHLATVLAAAVLAGGFALAGPAQAKHCSGSTTPPTEYSARGRKQAITGTGYVVQYDTSKPLVGTYYADGYVYVDGANPDGVTVRAFVPFWPEYADVKVILGPGATKSCKHVHGEYPGWVPTPPPPVPTPAPVDI